MCITFKSKNINGCKVINSNQILRMAIEYHGIKLVSLKFIHINHVTAIFEGQRI